MKRSLLLAISTLTILTSCSSVETYKTDSDIKDISELTKHQFVSYLNQKSPSYLRGRLCNNVFKTETFNQEIKKIEVVACITPLLKDIGVRDISNPFEDMRRNSHLANYSYYLTSIGAMKSKTPYLFGANDSFSGRELIHLIKNIRKLKK